MKKILSIFLILFFFNKSAFSDIVIYKSWQIPEKAKPNYETLVYYFQKYQFDKNYFGKYESDVSKNSYKFKFNLREDKYLEKQFKKTALLSYLLFENNEIVIDKISPQERFGKYINEDTKFDSRSIGKSLTSYVVGHAICAGYIKDLNHQINDWDLLENTLYENQRLLDLLNMRAGDQNYVKKGVGIIGRTGGRYANPNVRTLINIMKLDFQDSVTSKNKKYNYNALVTNILLNYVIFKSNGNFQNLLNNIFVDKAKVERNVHFFKQKNSKDEAGPARYSFVANRYDYLRIAKAMMDDWNNDTCVGKYLKNVYENRQKKMILIQTQIHHLDFLKRMVVNFISIIQVQKKEKY
tara:strand:- start:184 stop:1239 length:1056 start_codon:yes stop_codon:yes gene_type:complete